MNRSQIRRLSTRRERAAVVGDRVLRLLFSDGTVGDVDLSSVSRRERLAEGRVMSATAMVPANPLTAIGRPAEHPTFDSVAQVRPEEF